MDTKLENFYKNIGQQIKFLREEQNLTQEILADKAGISLNYLGKIEICLNKPGLRTIFKLAKALGVEPYEILKFKE